MSSNGSRRSPRTGALVSAFGFALALIGLPANAADRPEPLANTDALALLEGHCVKCHGGEKLKGGLDLTTRETLLVGGESGPAVSLADPRASLLYRMVAHLEEPGMPHKEDKLPDSAIAAIAAWLEAGAAYSRTLVATSGSAARQGFTISAADRKHWAFQPVRRPEPPAVALRDWVRTPVDAFIRAAQEAQGLAPAAAAPKEVLVRRVTFDLIGLPPTPEEIDAFVRDESPDAYSRLVERLLASPHYGERWGRHWLDLARFAETDGFEHDAVRPHAWRYRDYVVRVFNADKPYDRFVQEQIAGDELFPGEPDALVATAFNLLGPDMVDSADQIQRRRNTLNDMTDTTALAFLGLTMACARCHDHKFEPLSQRDYYSLQAYFAPSKFRPDLPVPTPAEREAYEAAMKVYNEQTQHLQDQIAALETPYRTTLYERKLSRLSAEAQAAHRAPREQRTVEQENQIQETAAQLAITAKELTAAMNKADREKHRELLDALKPFPKPKPLPATLGLQAGSPVKTHVLHRGDYNQPGEEVSPDVPEILRTAVFEGGKSSHGKNRAALARWITSGSHPLTARVMVNRIWRQHFGRGLVASASDFGTHGQKPSHPELLDWLASEFVSRGWSVKEMHRLVLHSATYRQDTRTAAHPDATAAAAIDPENRFYWRMNRLRLEGEVIRDSLLAISGQLNRAMGGPGVFPPIPKELFEGAKGWTPGPKPEEHRRRSLYIFARRNLRFPFLEVFDAPDSNLSCAGRERSTTAPQSLTLLNADEVVTASALTAQRIAAAHASGDAQIASAYRLILGRSPTDHERSLSRAFLTTSPLPELCRALFNLNAFLYVE